MTRMHNRATGRGTKRVRDDGLWAEKIGNGKSRIASKDEASVQIERYLKTKKWIKARALIQEQLVYEPADHWLWLHLGLTYYEEEDYEKALKCSQWAIHLQPDCPLGLWHLAGSLCMTGNEAAAVAVWTSLLHMDIEEVAYGAHGEGMEWALQLLNDVHFRLGRYYQRVGEERLAAESYQKYLHNRRRGVGSIYESKKAEELLAQVSQGQ